MLEVLYPVRDGDHNDELRFSLRSLAVNLPPARVWIVGHKPSWLRNVEFIPACKAMPPQFVVFNDDFYVMGPLQEVPILHRGLLAEQVSTVVSRAGRHGWWQESLLATQKCLTQAGHNDPLSYELHVPLPVARDAMADALARFAHVTPRNPPQWRTLYGVTHNIGGRHSEDCKQLRPGPISRPFHSTDDTSWRYFRSRFHQLFPDPSPFEDPDSARLPVNVTNQLRVARRIHRA
jgi:hypothetical protein